MIDPRPPQTDPTLNPYTRLIIIAGVLVVVSSCVLFLVNANWSSRALIWSGFGMVLLLLAVLLQPDAIQSILMGRPVKYGSNTMIVSLAFMGILVFVNYVSLKSNYEIDLTETEEFTLSEQTIHFLNSLNEPVQVMGFFKAGDDNWQQAEAYLERYSQYTNYLTYALLDPNSEPAMAQSYNLHKYGLIFIKGTQHYQANHVNEQAITTGLMIVTNNTNTQKSINIPPKISVNRWLNLTPIQAGVTFAITVIALPFIVFLVGAAMWWTQR